MDKRSPIFWAITLAELVIAVCAVTAFAWDDQGSAGAEAVRAQASVPHVAPQ